MNKSSRKTLLKYQPDFRFLLRCLKFDITVKYKPGKSIPVADALSRVCFKEEKTVKHDIQFITTKSCPIDINSVQEATMQDKTSINLKMLSLRDDLLTGNSVHKNCRITGYLDVT